LCSLFVCPSATAAAAAVPQFRSMLLSRYTTLIKKGLLNNYKHFLCAAAAAALFLWSMDVGNGRKLSPQGLAFRNVVVLRPFKFDPTAIFWMNSLFFQIGFKLSLWRVDGAEKQLKEFKIQNNR
jgi:hypothetical protein